MSLSYIIVSLGCQLKFSICNSILKCVLTFIGTRASALICLLLNTYSPIISYQGYKVSSHRLTDQKSPEYSNIKYFNALPNEMESGVNLGSVKKAIFNLLIKAEPYNVNEYFDYLT